ncbi:MAG: EAL domain-containing protein [Ruminococcus sp.]|nr:EAL domain-containing protein [Ruminococcus sp.]
MESKIFKDLKKTVLIVDDEPVNQKMLGYIVGTEYHVKYADNGVQALEVIEQNLNKISLVLLDLMMPIMDGYTVLKKMKKDKHMKLIPVMVLTSEVSAEVNSLKLGAVDFIRKPYDMPEVILARVKRSIELVERNRLINTTKTDTLTGLFTREYFYEYCANMDTYNAGAEMDAVAINVNRFHLVNELHGHSFGDNVLRAISDELKFILDRTTGIACRCAPDTFFMYMPSGNNYAEIVSEIEHAIRRETGNSARISIRMGVYEKCGKNISITQRFERAIVAGDSLKKNYSSEYMLYDLKMYETEMFGERLISDMDDAINGHQFKIHYQPKFTIGGDNPKLCGAEALVRWDHPRYGMISPGVFIPIFEKNGLIRELDHYVWNNAARQIKEWETVTGKTVPVSVNVSRVDIYDPELASTLLAIQKAHSLSNEELILEITESAYTDDSGHLAAQLDKLRNLGFRLEMDDFGSGFSSLNMLTSINLDAIKLDMRFVKNILNSEKDAKIVKLVKEIAEFLELPVIAEGVETKEQYLLLKEIGIEIIQGFYFSKPLPAAEFEKFLTGGYKYDN